MNKVLHLISGGDAGGAKTHIFHLIGALKDRQAVKIICFIRDRFYREAVEKGLPIDVVEQKNRLDMKVMKTVSREAREEEVDLLHCHGARANFNSLFFQGKIPKITTIHSDYKLDFQGNPIKNLIFTPLNVLALKKFDYYICITEAFKEMLVERGFPRERIFTVYNGIDLEKREEMVSKEDFLNRYAIEDRGQVFFVIAARLDQVKDHRTLIHAVERLEKKDPGDYQVLIAGEGGEGPALKSMVKEKGLEHRVVFLGQVDDPFSLYHAGDVNLLTSKSESFPYALLEGAKCKIPAIASDTGGIPEMIRSGEDGFLFPPGNPDALAQAMATILPDRKKREEMGESFYRRVEEKFTVEAMAQDHVKIYERIRKNHETH